VLPNPDLIDRFIEKLPELFATDMIRIEKIPGKTETNWDTPARQIMKQKFDAWLKQELGLRSADVEETLFVEGLSRKLPASRRGKFFGSVCCPDLALMSNNDDYTIAVELDHGASGAKLRNALAKASFNVLVGGFKQSIVLFFVEAKDRQQRETKFDPDHRILNLFKKEFKTSVLFITNYESLP
jgi:hypothetical protein